MINQHHHETLEPNEFQGFEEARHLMWCHEARVRVWERLALTTFIVNTRVAAVHIDNTSRADRTFLTAFDAEGRKVSADTLYTDEPGHHMDVAPEFDHDFTRMPVAPQSELEEAVAREDGWVVNMAALRNYDLITDRRATQRAVVLAHLPDLMRRGQARGFLFGEGESGSADAA